MGQIAGWRDFALGVTRLRGRRRALAITAIAPYLLLYVVGLVSFVILIARIAR